MQKNIAFFGTLIQPSGAIARNNSDYARLTKKGFAFLITQDFDQADVYKHLFFLDKPKTYKLNISPVVISIGDDQPDIRFLKDISLKRNLVAEDKGFLDKAMVPDLRLYFKEGLPRPVKFSLRISKNGRVEFLNKVISSGNFDADMQIQRMLNWAVFDTYFFGNNHHRFFELNYTK